MNGLELNMDQTDLDERVFSIFLMKIRLKRLQALAHLGRWWRNKMRVTWTRPTDPILRTPEFSGLLRCASNTAHQSLMHLLDESQRKRKPFIVAYLLSSKRESIKIITHLL